MASKVRGCEGARCEGAGCEVAGCEVAGCEVARSPNPGSRSPIPNPQSPIPNPQSPIPNPPSPSPESRITLPIDGSPRPASLHEASSWLEILLRRGQWLSLVLPAVVFVISWTWVTLMARDMYGTMQGPSAWMMTLVWSWPQVLLLWLMWAAMMVAMMLPTAAPLILLYGAAARRSGDVASVTTRVHALAAGYVLMWALFSVAATALQRGLTSLFLLTPMMEAA